LIGLGEFFDLLVVGAGPVGCVVAERAANEFGWSVLIVEKRSHVGGNCYDRYHESGLFIHEYGPHFYRTDSEEQIQYLSRFTEWIPSNHIVKSSVRGNLYPFPINLDTLEQFFGRPLTPASARRLLDRLRVPIDRPSNSEEIVVSAVGRELYEAFFLGYTVKQWGMHPMQLDASVCARIPLKLDRDPRYVSERFQLLPRYGYTRMFENMIRHDRIKVVLGADYREVISCIKPPRATVYTGQLDDYFDFRLGRLSYRSIRHEYEVKEVPYAQPCVVINYPNDFKYIRSIEYKHTTGQESPNSIVAYQYSFDGKEPYYPIPSPSNERLADQYRALADREQVVSRVYFVGRLAEYRYYNIDQVIDRALAVFLELAAVKSS
jgi:UDP-galactopyranose mutase